MTPLEDINYPQKLWLQNLYSATLEWCTFMGILAMEISELTSFMYWISWTIKRMSETTIVMMLDVLI